MIQATSQDIPTLIQILAPPFADNLSVNRCVKQDHKKSKRIENQIQYISQISIRNEFAFVNSTKTGAVLGNLSQGKKATLLDDWYFLSQVSGIRLGLELLQREKLLKQIPPPINYFHLWFIGVEKASQSKGIGSKMLKYIQQHCQERNVPIYLETSNPKNFGFYEKNGFTCYHKTKLPMDDFELYFYTWKPLKE